MNIRIGIGYDIHRLEKGKKLLLGGVEIPSPKGVIAHSDGDVLLHAVCDGLLGACGLGDIGRYFPDTDAKWKGISSIELLKKTYDITNKKSECRILNIDTVVICDEPKLAKHTDKMKKKISESLKMDPDKINIKAKTTEGTAEDRIVAYATVLVEVE